MCVVFGFAIGVSAILVTIDAFLLKNEWKYIDFWKTLVYGICYILMSVIYCMLSEDNIYGKKLDWKNETQMSAIVSCSVAFMVPIFHILLTFFKKRIVRKQFSCNDLCTKIKQNDNSKDNEISDYMENSASIDSVEFENNTEHGQVILDVQSPFVFANYDNNNIQMVQQINEENNTYAEIDNINSQIKSLHFLNGER